MQPVNLFSLASEQAKWLSVRQAAVSGNIANVHTPGYAAKDVEPFEQVLANTRVGLNKTHVNHVSLGATEQNFQVREIEPSGPELPGRNSVTIEQELMKAGEVRRGIELNTGIVKAFHRMYLMTTRG
ncbi:flagellar basal body rod protein FlgB [Aliihoeflea aestuarii]|jgi:flagellar basal-body rod protein FlgB|uniref:flagellar basal body rod protein FlgB n=1 Tax=Aliihoeflea aestuarii TaxID=453840 RepID=UPI0020951230|nr:flagellar basal body rod protein FlgB [Aliihoeflea aestuarii]MCO6392882.1 flagellar basal body rod protein FlgB [Aliihoeflea aestuarii]